jgi:hypothetical protein
VTSNPDPLPAVVPRARRRLGLVALLYAYRAVSGIVLALPAVVALGAPAASFPRGQAELFDPGAVMLIEALRLGRRALLPVGASAATLAVLVLVGSILLLGALLAGLGRAGRLTPSFLGGRAFAHAGTLALISGAAALFAVAAGGVVAAIGGKVVRALHLDPPADDLAGAVLAAVVLGLVLLTFVVRDLASAAAVRGEHGFYGATSRAIRAARRAPGRTVLDWGWRAALGTGVLLLAACLSPRGASASATAAGVALHQGALFLASLARVSWLAAALRRIDEDGPAELVAAVAKPNE